MNDAQRRACRILAEREWEATRGEREPTWDRLTQALRDVWLSDTERFIGRFLAIEAREQAGKPEAP